MDIFSVSAKIKLDDEDFNSGIKKAGEKLGDFASGMGKALGTVTKIGAGAVGAGAVAIGALVKQAVDAFGRYEQLAGGVETLFKDASDTVMENAKNAYATAGMSANEYMETATSFAASLIQSTGRGVQQDLDALTEALDEEYIETKRALEDEYEEIKSSWDDRIKLAKASGAENVDLLKSQKDEELKALKRSNQDQLKELKNLHKDQIAAAEEANSTSVTTEESLQRAAELADVAMRDISDNVNKMGSTQESIRTAYAGFAKQNFTMLDNLKLGYGGTKKEMERLLKDAEKLSGKKFDVSSYADIVEAIHIIQEEMGITGTTAEEAEHTIEGSIGATRAAWENLITGLGDKNADLSELVNNVINSGTKAAENLAPVVGAAVDGIITVVTEKAPEIIGDAEKGTGLAGAIKNGLPKITTAAATLVSAFTSQLPGILTAVIDIAPDVLEAAGSLVSSLVEAIPAGLNTITTMLTENEDGIAGIINGATDFIFEQVPLIVDAGLNLFSALLDDLPGIVSNLTAKLPEFIDRLLGTGQYEGQGLLAHTDDILNAGIDLLGSLLDNLPAIMDSLAQGLVDFVDALCEWLTDGETLKKLGLVGWKFTEAIIQGMGSVFENIGRELFGLGNESDEAFDLGQVMTDIKNGVDPRVAFERGNQRREYHDKAFDAIFSGDENAALYYMSGGREWVGERPGAVNVNVYGANGQEVVDEVTKALNKTGAYAQ